MREAEVYVHDKLAGILGEAEQGFDFTYESGYDGPPVSLTMPTKTKKHTFEDFPPFFEGLLPEGIQLDALLRTEKLDKSDYLGQLITVGNDLVGAVSVREKK
jgi:serine/threonine-protein kinase HipA